MPTGIEIAGFVIASTGMGGSVVSRAAKYAKKGTAQRTYDEVAHQYTQLKDLREDENINRYLSEKDKGRLDVAIEKIAFDLMDLQLTLHQLKGVAYYKITTYPVQWISYHDQVAVVFKQIVEVNIDISRRSMQGRDQARSKSTTQAHCPGPELTPQSPEEHVAVDQGSASGESMNQQIVNAMASSAATALRVSVDGGVKTCPLGLAESRGGGLSSGRRSTTENGLKPGLKWKILPKSASVPSLTVAKDIELEGWAKEID